MSGGTRVLVLDFDENLLMRLEQLLEDSGFSTTTSWDVGEALNLLQSGYFDFLVVGNRPPKLDPVNILKEVRQRGVRCGHFVMLSPETTQDFYTSLIARIRTYSTA